VILFVLLCGFPPYEGTQGANGRPDYPKTLQKIQQRCDAEGRFNYFPDPYWSSISKSAQDLIRSMVPPPLRPSLTRLPRAAILWMRALATTHELHLLHPKPQPISCFNQPVP
jgi:serine/threonine protein kinase